MREDEMAEVKIEFRLGEIEFKGEGDKKWIGEQLDKPPEKAPKLVKLSFQVRKHLATAVWLHAKGKELLNTKYITIALKASKQENLDQFSDKRQ